MDKEDTKTLPFRIAMQKLCKEADEAGVNITYMIKLK